MVLFAFVFLFISMWDSQKRPVDQDPDYESIPLHAQQKRIKLHEQDAKEATVRKIEQIVKSRFSEEISARESELDTDQPEDIPGPGPTGKASGRNNHQILCG
uniref:Secreted protein n=1 Tax=Ixodes ricinus TaxID=34613 RepID=A0A0K8RLT6_IXORI